MSDPFVDFVTLELPKRPTMLTTGNTGYNGDPNSGGAPAVISGAPLGTFYLALTGNALYKKNSASAATWELVGSGGGGGGTTAPLVWHVETTGNDSTGDGSVGNPFATPGGALAALAALSGKLIRHQVDIILGTGNFPAFSITGYMMDPAVGTAPCGIRIYGSFINATPGSGTATGTFTTVTTGNDGSVSGSLTKSTVTDSGQTWPVNGLKGFMLEVLTGTSAGQILPILSNTATTIEVPLTSAFGSVGGTYAVRDWGAVINTSAAFPPSLPAVGAAAATPQQASILVANCVSLSPTIQIRMENLKIHPLTAAANASGFVVQDAPVSFTRSYFGGIPVSGGGTRVNVTGDIGNVTVSSSVILTRPAGTGISAAGTGQQLYAQNLITAPSGGGSIAMSVSGNMTIFATLCNLDPHSFGISITGQAIMSLSGTKIVNTSGNQCLRSRVIEGNTGGVFISASSLELSSSTSAGLELQGPAFAAITNLSGSGTLYAISLSYGARLKVGPLSTITGTNEVIMDDFAAPTTLAVMRAQTPKALTNSYGTVLSE
jgi:hypothetical protein